MRKEVGELEGSDLRRYIKKQDNLNAKGVTVLMAEALAYHSPGSEGDFSDTAAELMIELVSQMHNHARIRTRERVGALIFRLTFPS